MATQEDSIKKLKTLQLYQLSHSTPVPALQRKLIKRFTKHVNQYSVKLPESIEGSYINSKKWISKVGEYELLPSDLSSGKIIEFDTPIESITLDTCKNCEILLIPGYNLKVRISTDTSSDRKTLRYHCLNCDIEMRFKGVIPNNEHLSQDLSKSSSSGDFIRKLHQINSDSKYTNSSDNTSNKLSDNKNKGAGSSNKGFKKNDGKKKKGKNSLSQMLLAKKESESKNKGFDLFDMMKQG